MYFLLIVILSLGLVLILGAVLTVVFANRLPWFVLLLAAGVLLPVQLFFVYGLIASMEPGPGHIWWRLMYATGTLLFTAIEVALVIKAAKRIDKSNKR